MSEQRPTPGAPGDDDAANHPGEDDGAYSKDSNDYDDYTYCGNCGCTMEGHYHGVMLTFCEECCLEKGIRVLADGCDLCKREPLDQFRLAMRLAITAELLTKELPSE